MHGLKIFLILACILTLNVYAKNSVVDSVHNLSISGPGKLKSQSVDDVCVFCHTPHRGKRNAGIWNRGARPFRQYESSTSEALPSPSSLKSELCLSCHDGTVALGQMLRPPRSQQGNIHFNDLRGTFLTGRGRFGNDLSNHHPVAITYDASLVENDKNLNDPSTIDLPLYNGELHCTTCHDPHSSDPPPFLNQSTLNGELCLTCHAQSGKDWDWISSSHAQSDAMPLRPGPWKERKAEWKGKTVSENACMNCHAPHNAATPERLIGDVEERVCFRCHDGTFGEGNIKFDSQKFSRHPVETSASGAHDSTLTENPYSMQLHVECEDCHNPHATRSDSPMISFNPNNPMDADHSQPPIANDTIIGVSGIDINGGVKEEIEFEYELCFKCHGVPANSACGNQRCSTAEIYRMERLDQTYNLRDKVDSSNPTLQSYHPIETNNPANNDEVPSLRVINTPLNRSTSLIYCGDCHNSEMSPAAGGKAPGGTHGSRHEGLLALEYPFNPDRNFSATKNVLCFKCHDTASLNSNESFPHRQHVLDNGFSCINCHDPHGSTVYPHLINFLTSATVTGQTLEITGVGGFGEPIWVDNGRYSGTCYLNCHGTEHDGVKYPADSPVLRK